MFELADIDLAQFLTKWHGLPDRSPIRRLDHPELPTPLLEWHELSSQWSTSLLGVKSFVPLDEISFHDGKAVFLADPADAIWAFDSSANVYEGRRYGDWIKLRESLQEFLIHNAVEEAPHSAHFRKSCSSVANARIPDVLASMTEVAVAAWYWPGPGYRLFMNDNLIAEVGPALEWGAPIEDEDGFSEVQIGASDLSALSYLESIPGDWF
ncbi:hypothetical protein ACIRP3_41905 [Streptomyces sp. NPDC101209]|uniref:hypothetical protein n=1 Tax=Streptomyces sp. NPDC101209 TaxID=3366129 RepID=UPI0038131045